MAARFQNLLPGAAVLRGARRGPSGDLRCFAADGFLAHGKDAAAPQVRRRLQYARGTHERVADRLFRSAAAGLLGATPVLVRLQRRSSLQFSSRRPRSTPRRGASRPAISVDGHARGKHPAGKSVSAGRRDRRGGTHSGGKGLPPGERYAVLRPGAGDVSKRWPVENFAAIAHWLRERYALTPVVNLGPGDEEIAAEVRERLAPLSVIVDSLDLRQLMALLGGASLFVGNDTGPTHIAAALQKRCVAIFGTSDSAAWSPWKTEHRVVENKFPCERCPRGTLRKLAGVAVHSHGQRGASARSLRSAARGKSAIRFASRGSHKERDLNFAAAEPNAPALGIASWRWRRGSRRSRR